MRSAFGAAVLAMSVSFVPDISAESQHFVSGGYRIQYEVEGSGDTVVLVHGFTGSSGDWVTSGVFAALAKDYRVVALDLRGHGQSAKPHDASGYGDQMAMDVIRLMDHLGVRRAHVVGYSQGARIVGFLLTKRPERFISAVLGGSPPHVGWPQDEATRAMQDADRMVQLGRQGQADGQDYAALAAVARSREQWAVTPQQIARITVPTIGIVGSNDPRITDMVELKTLLPSLQRVVVVEGAEHWGERGTLQRPEFINAVRELLKAKTQKR